MKILFSVLFIIVGLSSAYGAAPFSADPNSRVVVNSYNLPLLQLIEDNYKVLLGGQSIYPERFLVAHSDTSDGDACRSAGRREAQSTLEFRDEEGLLHTVSHIICIGESASNQTFILRIIPGSEQVLPEIGFKKEVWVFSKADSNVNDDGGVCDTNKTVVQQVCAPAPYRIYSATVDQGNIIRSSKSELNKVEIDPQNLNCVNVTFLLGGQGYNYSSIGHVRTDCAEGAWFKYTIHVKGYMTGFRN